MHLPDYLLHGSVTILTWLATLVLLTVAAWPGLRHTHAVRPFEFASVAALIFSLQMVQFPVGNVSSGHVIGGVLAGILLGVRSGMIAMGLVLLIQSVLFSDGGFGILGANVFNMAILATGFGGWLSRQIVLGLPQKRVFWCLAPALAAAFSVQSIGVACAIELAWGGAAPFSFLIGPILLSQIPIAIIEGILTFAAVWLLTIPSEDPETSPLPVAISMRVVWAMLGAILIATLIAPLSSPQPAAVQTILAQQSWWPLGTSSFYGVLPGYYIPDISGKTSISLAGLLGVFTVFMFGWFLEQCFFHLIKKPQIRRAAQFT